MNNLRNVGQILGCEMNGSTCDIPPPNPAAGLRGISRFHPTEVKNHGHSPNGLHPPTKRFWLRCRLCTEMGKPQEFGTTKSSITKLNLVEPMDLCQALREYKKDPTNAATYCKRKQQPYQKKT